MGGTGRPMRSPDSLDIADLRDPSGSLDMLGDTVSFHIRLLDLMIARDLNHRLHGLELTRGKGYISCLLLIDSHPGIRPSMLADRIHKDRAHVTRILGRFHSHGLIARRVAADDSRASELSITTKGAALAARLRKIIAEHEEQFYQDILTPEDRAPFLAILQRVYLGMSAAGTGVTR